MALEFGIFDTFSVPDWESGRRAEMYDRHIEGARIAEEAGFKSLFFIEHQNPPVPCISAPPVYLAALAAATSQLRLGAMVFQVPMYNPIRLAQDVALVDQLSKGRVEFGIGYGVVASEFEPWKLNFNERRAMGVEALEIVLQAWTNKEVTYRGKYWTFERARPEAQPYQQPHPPLWMGGHSRDSMDYAIEKKFPLSQIHGTEKVIAERFEYFRNAWSQRGNAGPPPRTLLVREVHVAETDEKARAQAEPYMLEGLLGRFGVQRAKLLRPDEASPERLENAKLYLKTAESFDFWIDEGLAFVGSPETVIRKIKEQQQLIGYDVLLTHHTINSMPQDLWTKSVKLFGKEVMPAFRSAKSAARVVGGTLVGNE